MNASRFHTTVLLLLLTVFVLLVAVSMAQAGSNMTLSLFPDLGAFQLFLQTFGL